MKNLFRKRTPTPQEVFIRTYLDSIAPGVVKFEVDHYIFGNTYRSVWALREYPASTESQAILRHLGEKSGVTLRIYCRQVSPGEEDRIIDNANKKNKLDGADPNKLRQAVEAESNLRDVAELVHKMHREHEPLLHCSEVDSTIRLSAPQYEAELPRGGHHGLHIVQMPSVLRQQRTDGGVLLPPYPLAVEKPIVLKGLFGIQRQHFYFRHAFQHTQQRRHSFADSGFRQHVQVGGLHKVK